MQSPVAEFFQIRRAGRDVDVGEIGEHAVDAQPEERLIRGVRIAVMAGRERLLLLRNRERRAKRRPRLKVAAMLSPELHFASRPLRIVPAHDYDRPVTFV